MLNILGKKLRDVRYRDWVGFCPATEAIDEGLTRDGVGIIVIGLESL